MRKLFSVCVVAALVAMAIPSVASAQTWEIQQFFSGLSTSPPGAPVADPTTNPSITVPATGGTVYLPIFIRMQVGNSTGQPQVLSNFMYGISGVPTGGAAQGQFSLNAGGTGNRAVGAYADPLLDMSGFGSNIAGANAPQVNFNIMTGMGYQGLPPGNTNAIGSVGATLTGNVWVGTLAINIGPGTAGQGLDLYFREGASTPLATNPYNVSDGVGSAQNLAYGVGGQDGAGNPDWHRFGATTALNGLSVQANFFSQAADASIRYVPEPGTLGLLGLGVLGLLRRRAK